ncbi:Hypothetical predicted protein [Scomber scombrus]|uniref:Uncharacterized protein n=1 Tax=Scomber scombrus TaxID=13677 RepID=A0AAV1P6K5_SCOSC
MKPSAHGSITTPASYSNAAASRKARREDTGIGAGKREAFFAERIILRLGKRRRMQRLKDVYLAPGFGTLAALEIAGSRRRRTRERVGRGKQTRRRRPLLLFCCFFLCHSYVGVKELMSFCALLYTGESWQAVKDA